MKMTKKRKIWQSCIALLAGWQVISCESQHPSADASNAVLVGQGKEIYINHCARCHGNNLEGEPNWQIRKPDGKLPAPPHNESGHTWHHPDRMLFGIVKQGLTPPYAPANYLSDMPSFSGTLTDEQIWAVLAYIKSTWPEQARAVQEKMNDREGNR